MRSMISLGMPKGFARVYTLRFNQERCDRFAKIVNELESRAGGAKVRQSDVLWRFIERGMEVEEKRLFGR